MANITSSSVANPTVITATSHGLADGATVVIAGHTGSTPDINGQWRITVTGANTFTIPVSVTAGGTGGVATLVPKAIVPISQKVMTAAQAATYIGSLPAELVWIGDAFRARLFDGNTLGGWQVGPPIKPNSDDGFVQQEWLLALGIDAIIVENPGGFSPVDTLYYRDGDEAGKPKYRKLFGSDTEIIQWVVVVPSAAEQWEIKTVGGGFIYFTSENVATPDLVSSWSFLSPATQAPTVRRPNLSDLTKHFSPPHGQASWNSTQAVAIDTAGTFVQAVGLTTTTGNAFDFNLAADGLTYIGQFPKRFQVTLIAEVESATADKVVAARIGIGSSTIASSESRDYSQSNRSAKISTSWILELKNNDKVTAHFANITDDANLTIQRGQLVVTEI